MLTTLALLIVDAVAANVMQDCASGDAPTGWDTVDCDTPGEGDVCTYTAPADGSGLIDCFGSRLSDSSGEGVTMYAVYDYDGNGKVSMWGTSAGFGIEKFCCVLNDVDDDLYKVTIYGTLNDDYLYLNYGSGAENLSNLRTTEFLGMVNGQAGVDTIQGSYATSTYYVETLLGGSGNDTISGNAGADIIQGNNGTDTLIGGSGNDLLCDQEDGDLFDAGGGDDSIWYALSTTPPNAASTANSTFVSGENVCGDQTNDWGDDNITDYIENCGAVTVSEPADCPAW